MGRYYLTIMKWTFRFGFIMIFPFSFRIVALSSFVIYRLTFGCRVYSSIFYDGFAYCLVDYSLKTVSPNVDGIYIFISSHSLPRLLPLFWGKTN